MILEKSPNYINLPKIAEELAIQPGELVLLTNRFPLKIIRALKLVFNDGVPISQAAKENDTSKQMVRYYIQKMHVMKNGKKYKRRK